MYGGVRCEKASAYLIKQGYNAFFNLMVELFLISKTKNKNKKWTGECFVFDEEVTLDDNLTKGNMINVMLADQLLMISIKNPRFKMGVYCPKCKNTSNKQKKGLRKEKTNFFSKKKRGLNHLGN